MYEFRLKLQIKSDLTAHECMKTKLKIFIAHVQIPNLTDIHWVNSNLKHGILNGHDVSIAPSINIPGLKKQNNK
jgi:hypothetical protein